MTVVAQQSNDLRAIAEHLKSTAEQTRPTFTDESRPQFDHRVIDAMRNEIRNLSFRVSELDVALENALRLLE
ncbi:hypothetical protein [Arthrobacter sp. LjRoot14]|uniref:hypothetical protein n=1 Tax=Arthrobacter sp. LjRoot14 TaxID=3342265 RepID=UPI003ECC4A4C